MKKKTKKNADSPSTALRILWEEGYFNNWSVRSEVEEYLNKRGNNFPEHNLRMALARAKFLTSKKRGGVIGYIQKNPPISEDIENIESQLFDHELIEKLGKSFEKEINDLHINFGRSGNCTAFLLRKILEKLIYITFAKNNLSKRLEDSCNTGRMVGLEAMINIASTEKIKNIPFITPKTAQEIKGIKFLGDVSSHNPLIDVDMKTIIPQMPYLITAYKELAEKL